MFVVAGVTKFTCKHVISATDGYMLGVVISGLVFFFGVWIYLIATLGFFWGFGIGWLPALITAFVLCWFWPVYVLGGALLALLIMILHQT